MSRTLLLYVAGFAALAATAAAVASAASPTRRSGRCCSRRSPRLTVAGAPGTRPPAGLAARPRCSFPLGAYLLAARRRCPRRTSTSIDEHRRPSTSEQLKVGRARVRSTTAFRCRSPPRPTLRLLLSAGRLRGGRGWPPFFGSEPAHGRCRPSRSSCVLAGIRLHGRRLGRRPSGRRSLFLLLAGCMLVLSRSLQRERWRDDGRVGGRRRPRRSRRCSRCPDHGHHVGRGRARRCRTGARGTSPVRESTRVSSFDWMENYPRLLDPDDDARVMRVTSPVASYWRANVLSSFDRHDLVQ